MARPPRTDAWGLPAQPRDYAHIVTWIGFGVGVIIFLGAMSLMGQAEPVAGILLLGVRLGLMALIPLSIGMLYWNLHKRHRLLAVLWLVVIPVALIFIVLLAPLRTS